MANLVRLKQIDNPELSGYIVDVTNDNYYPVGNPSGYLSSVSSDSAFISLSGNLITSGYNLNNSINSVSGAIDVRLISSGSILNSEIVSLSGDLNSTNNYLNTVSGLATTAIYLTTGLQYSTSGAISGEVAVLNSTITGTSGVLNSTIVSVSGSLDSRVSSLESNFATTGSNFLDLTSNNQTVNGTKTFSNRIGFNQIDLLPYTGNYSNPGGQHGIVFTQVIPSYSFTVSGYGIVTGALFATKMMQQNNVECIISSAIYTGAY